MVVTLISEFQPSKDVGAVYAIAYVLAVGLSRSVKYWYNFALFSDVSTDSNV